ncbi:MAG: hypothetical protein WBB82_00625 [Limnothrix sp.]
MNKRTKLILKFFALAIATIFSLNSCLPAAISQGNSLNTTNKNNFPTQVLPYPLQTISAASRCLILNPENRENWTPQEIKASEIWSISEMWAWQRLCIGRTADFQEFDNAIETSKIAQNTIESASAEQQQTLRSREFLEVILKREPFRSALPEKLSIANVTIPDNINLNSASIQQELEFKAVIFNENVNLFKTDFKNALSFICNQNSLDQKCEQKTIFKGVLSLNNSKFDKKVKIDGADFELPLPKSNSPSYVSLNLSNVTIHDDLQLNDITFDLSQQNERIVPVFSLESTTINQSLQLGNINFKDPENLSEANSHLLAKGLTVDGKLTVQESFSFSCNESKSCYRKLDLSNSQINTLVLDLDKSQLAFNRAFTKNILFLKNAVVETFQILKPANFDQEPQSFLDSAERCGLKLDGFQYQSLNDFAFAGIRQCLAVQYQTAKTSSGNDDDFFFSRDELVQPHEQLAAIANSLGKSEAQRQILYTKAKLQHYDGTPSWESTLSFLQDWFYGFGYKRKRVFFPMAILFTIGFSLSYYVLCRKQEQVIQDAIKSSLTELREERLMSNGEINLAYCQTISLSRIVPYIDSISRALFVKPEKETKEPCFSVFLSFDYGTERTQLLKDCGIEDFSGSYFHLYFQNQKQLKVFLNSLNLRNSGCTKVGLCDNLFGVPEVAIPGIKQSILNRHQLPNQEEYNLRFYNVDQEEVLTFNTFRISKPLVSLIKITFILVVIAVILNGITQFVNPRFLLDSIVLAGFVLFSIALLINFISTAQSHRLKLRRIGSVTIHSIDLMFPIINLDEELSDFIFSASKELDGFWIRIAKIYFLVMKIVSGILAGIWIPILFSTGL